jgi:hypothetical protein
MRAAALALLAPGLYALAVGCAPTTVRSGLPPARVASQHHERWHAAFLFGALEASGPYPLARLCPEGWSEIQVGPDPFTLLAGALTLFLYSPTRVTIVCAAPRARPADPRAAALPPPLAEASEP